MLPDIRMLTESQREDLLRQISAWRASRTDPGDLAVLLALRFQLESEDIDSGAALEAVTIARRSVGRMPKGGRPARAGSVTRQV